MTSYLLVITIDHVRSSPACFQKSVFIDVVFMESCLMFAQLVLGNALPQWKLDTFFGRHFKIDKMDQNKTVVPTVQDLCRTY